MLGQASRCAVLLTLASLLAVACSDDSGPLLDAALRDGTPDTLDVDSRPASDGADDASFDSDLANVDGVSADTEVLPDAPEDTTPSSDGTFPADTALTDSHVPDVVPPDTGSSDCYNTDGWTMKTRTLSDSASTGTPDSYFFEVDPGSPLSASITGGGNGTWTVNVFGGMTNTLYCSGSPLCQVMLAPQDTTVIITAITTDIGYYTLTVEYSGTGCISGGC